MTYPLRHRRQLRALTVEPLESRQLLSATPFGALPQDTGEFMLGRVAVTPVFFDSDGTLDPSTENWTAAEIDQTLTKIRDGLNWWVDTLANYSSVHTLEFVIDERFARTPVATKYEPISRASNDHTLYVSDFLTAQGYGSGGLNDRVLAFNDAQRQTLQTDWSFSIFIADASADANGQFATGGTFGQAFAFAGGLYLVAPSVRPSATFTHETGHIFWASDEYSGGNSWQQRRGYYNTQNINSAENPTLGFVQQPSIMAGGQALQTAYLTHTSAASTRAMIGWQDSDGDGIFDVLDVPLEFEGLVAHDAATNQLRVKGTASAVALTNKSPEGFQSDISLNKIRLVEFRLNGGNWQTLTTFDASAVSVDRVFDLPATFSDLELRFADNRIGVYSNSVHVAPGTTTFAGKSVQGVVFIDDDKDQLLDSAESSPENWQVLLERPDGSSVTPQVNISAAQLPDGFISDELFPGVQLSAPGPLDVGLVGVDSSTGSPTRSFSWFSVVEGGWHHKWSDLHPLRVVFDQPQQVISIEFIADSAGDDGKLEAFDAQGKLLARKTTGSMTAGQRRTLTLAVPTAEIAAIEARARVGELLLDKLIVGPTGDTQTDATGRFQFLGIADGSYRIRAVAPSNTYRTEHPIASLTVSGGIGSVTPLPFYRYTSPWQNQTSPTNVDNKDSVQPLDALLVINLLNSAGGSRELGPGDSTPPYVDVNGDGMITPLDALLVINELNSTSGGGEPLDRPVRPEANAYGSENLEFLSAQAAPPLVVVVVSPAQTQGGTSAGEPLLREAAQSEGEPINITNSWHSSLIWDSWETCGDYDSSRVNDWENSKEPFDFKGFQELHQLLDVAISEIFA